MRRTSWCIGVVVIALGSWSAAQQPLRSPVYYLSSAPQLLEGVPVTGVLHEGSGRNFKDGTYLDVMVLRGEAGRFVEIVATSAEFDTYLTLVAPDGEVVATNDDDPLGYGTDAAIRATLPVTGTYLVVVSGFGPWDLGPYTVTLGSGAGAGTAERIDVPSLTFGTLHASGAPTTYTFELTERSALLIEARSATFDTTLDVLDAWGWSIAFNDDAPTSDGYGTDSALAVLLAPGSYQIAVGAYGGWLPDDGAFELSVQPLTTAP